MKTIPRPSPSSEEPAIYDFRGNRISKDSLIVYTVRRSSSVWFVEAVVEAVGVDDIGVFAYVRVRADNANGKVTRYINGSQRRFLRKLEQNAVVVPQRS